MSTKKSPGYPTLQSIAQQLGLSRTTVAEILGGNDRYAEKTRTQVLDAARLLNYRPDRSAQTVRRGRSNLIGVMHFGGPLQVANERAYYLGRNIIKTGYELLLADSLWYPPNVPTRIDHMISSRVEGFIFSGPSSVESGFNSAILKQLGEAHIPTVLVSSSSVKGVSTVNSDFADGFYQLTRHLLDVGHRRLTLLLASHPESYWHGVKRLEGFVRAIQEAGGQVRPPTSVNEYRNVWNGGGIQGEVLYSTDASKGPFCSFDLPQDAMEKLLDNGFTADALLASNDEWAAGVISVCIRRGVDVPRHLAVTGFDNSNIAKLSPVPITTASQQSEETCRIAVDLLVKRMQGLEETDSDILLPCPIIIRASSGRGMRLSAPLRERS